MRENPKSLCFLLAVALLQACAANIPRENVPVPVEDRSVVDRSLDAQVYPSAVAEGEASPYHDSRAEGMPDKKVDDDQPVMIALLKESEHKAATGDYSAAAATLERALRLQPKNARLWHNLGLLRLKQKDWQQAIDLAGKSNSLAAGDYPLQAANWKIIAQANSRAGNKSAAASAAEKALALERLGRQE